MRIRSVLTAAALLTSLAAFTTAAQAADTYTIDGSHTQVLFKTTHLGIGTFYGSFNKVDGSFTFDPDPAKASLDVTVAAKSVFTADRKRDEHLRGPDFFSVAEFPTITLKSTAVRAGKSAGTYDVDAKLTVRGRTKPISFTVSKVGEGADPWGNHRIGFEGDFTINRLDYGIAYMPDGLGKDVKIIIAVEGIRKK